MINSRAIWQAAAALGLAASLAACHGSSGSIVPVAPPPPPPSSTAFGPYAIKTFGNDANSTPVNFDKVIFSFDVDNDPTAFDALLK